MSIKQLIEEVPIEYLKECFVYNADTGKVFWSVRPRRHFSSEANYIRFNKRFSDIEAGNKHIAGYREISVKYKNKKYRILTHQLAALLSGWDLKYREVDHINRVRSDNRLVNLRLSTSQENDRNRSLGRNNKSGFTGVYYCKTHKKWKASINFNRRSISLGSFEFKEDAVTARLKAEAEYFKEFAPVH